MRLRCLFIGLVVLLWANLCWANIEIPLDNAPMRGPAEAPVTIIEFLDFQ